jgi:hypothetical protein
MERSELRAVLQSGILDRAANLRALLTYVCSRYFEGEAEQMKEYNIAVEVFGRSPDFDPKRDSIVRVEAHRLRKRLHDYYAKEGAGHPVHIVIPAGCYVPRFVVPQSQAPSAQAAAENRAASRLPLEQTPAAAGRRPQRAVLAMLAVLAVLGGAAAAYIAKAANARRLPVSPTVDPVALDVPTEVRILAGAIGGSYVDGFGRAWQADRYFTGGSIVHQPNQLILGTRDPGMYRNRREGWFQYDIPLRQGVYELRLYFAETLFGESNTAGGGESTRLFNVYANGKRILSEFDVIKDVGASTADVKVFRDISPAGDGKVHLQFEPLRNPPFVNAIELTPGIPGKLRPLRFVARDRAITDNEGNRWEPDRLANGGQLVMRSQPAGGTAQAEIFRGERFGNITYSIPLPPGRYRVSLYFSETWFGPDNPGQGGVGSRIFDVLCNGVVLIRKFDIFHEVGSNRAVARTFHGLQPNAQGKLVISLMPVKNYSCINAIEIVDESS